MRSRNFCAKAFYILILGTTLSFTFAQAKSFYGDSYRDSRLLGRGNAGIADVTGGIAAFYNPAGLADSQVYSFMPVDLSLGFNKNIYDSISKISSLTSSSQTLSQKFSPLLGKPLTLQGSFFPHFAIPGAMLGFYDYLDVNIEYRDPVFPRLDLAARNDWGLIMGAGLNITSQLQIGGSVRYFRRKALDDSLNMASVFNFTGSYLMEIMKKGEAWGCNLGLRFRQPLAGDRMWMAAGLAVEDAGYSTFKNTNRKPLPSRQAQKINAGLGYGVTISSSNSLKLLFDLKELNESSKSYTKRIYTGAELSVPGFVFRSGLYQGYWTLGITTSLIPALDLDLTSYGEELGTAAGLKESRHWILGLRMGLDVKNKRGPRKRQKEILDKL
jgi:hypothetical protein